MTSPTEAEAVEARTSAGRVRGFWRAGSAAFLGIPFAEAPTGSRRFAAPVPVAAWEGVRDARAHGATAQRGDPGVTLIPEPSVAGDSTLNVNVFSPDPRVREDPLPVLVWIHGGGFVAGSPASDWYDGRAFNRDGVVTVSLGYRVGFDGFGLVDGAPANRAVLDWIAGLEWVRENIASFGGDPNRVTIAGQSAGGAAVLTLLGMPQAQYLFHGVYALSAALTDVPASTARRHANRIAEILRVPATRAGFASVSEDTLLAAQHKASTGGLAGMNEVLREGLRLGPVVDGKLLTRPTLASLAAGVGADKPLVLCSADDEFAMAVQPYAKFLRWIPRGALMRPFGLSAAVRRDYLAANTEAVRRGHAALLGRLVSDTMFRRHVVAVARARGEAPTWTSRMAFRSTVFGAAVHCIDVPFFFDCLEATSVAALTGENPPQRLADAVHGAAVAFARTGDPGWRPFPVGEAVFDAPPQVFRDAPGGYTPTHPLLSPVGPAQV